jgi:hypothetical protein
LLAGLERNQIDGRVLAQRKEVRAAGGMSGRETIDIQVRTPRKMRTLYGVLASRPLPYRFDPAHPIVDRGDLRQLGGAVQGVVHGVRFTISTRGI